MKKRKVKRFAEAGAVEIEERSTYSPEAEAEKNAKAPDDYAGMLSRASKMKNAEDTFRKGRASSEESAPDSVAGKGAENLALNEAGTGAKNLALEKARAAKPRAAKPRAAKASPVKTGSGASGFPTSVGMERGSDVMSRGRASTDGSGSSPLEKYKQDKEAKATRDKRKMDLAVERVKAGVGYKKGGSASSRGDGIAQRGKTRGKMY